jgi:hypothetical protein
MSIFLQSTDKVNAVLSDESYHQNQWRIFSKAGSGWSTYRYRGEIVENVYSCLPHYNSEGKAIGGYEFTITVRGTVPDDPTLVMVEPKVMDAFNGAMNFLFENF